MYKICFALLLVLFMPAMTPAQEHIKNNQPEVKTAYGVVRGISEEGVNSFKGIPYAAPPVGEYRWRPPQPVAKWDTIRDASKYCAECPQAGRGGMSPNASEDCLFLNLWAPATATPKSKLPVMVWIHGGGFVFGSGGQGNYNASPFTIKGVILVSINYRLGRLGFFAFPALSKEYPNEPKGNYAYMDQVAALKWVKDNITAFGGDPGNVTIFGESAGGVSVHSLITIPAAKGLFHKAIIESGGGRDGVLTGRPINKENASPHYPVSAETIGINFANRYKIEGTDAGALAKLRTLTAAEIVDGGQESAGPGGPATYSGPILDGKLVVETAESAYKSGRFAQVPIIIGSNSAEVPAGFVNATNKEELWNKFESVKDEMKQAYDPDGTTEFAKIMTLVNTDKVWAEPARFTARKLETKKIPAYVYLFSYVPEAMQTRMRFGASHASEIAYVFDNIRVPQGGTVAAKDKAVAELMNKYWTNFAKTGNPNGANLPQWPLYKKASNEVFEFKIDGTAGNVQDQRKSRLDVMEKAAEKQ